jgi:hypothetical protein
MAELTRETLPPAGPDYPLAADLSAGTAPPVIRRGRAAAAPAKARPHLLPEEPERRSDRGGDGS